MLTQRVWRRIGAASLAGCALMALYGPRVLFRESAVFFCVYWSIFLVLLLVTLWMVLLDLRYIRLQYTAGRRDIYNETLGEEEFRKTLHKAQKRDPRGGGKA